MSTVSINEMCKGVQGLALAQNGSLGTRDKWTPFFQYQSLSWATKRGIYKDPSSLSSTTSGLVVNGTCCQHLHRRLCCGIQSCNDKMQESEPIFVIGKQYELEQHDVVPIK